MPSRRFAPRFYVPTQIFFKKDKIAIGERRAFQTVPEVRVQLLHVIPPIGEQDGPLIDVLAQLASVHQEFGDAAEFVCGNELGSPCLEQIPLKVHALGPNDASYAHGAAIRAWLQSNVKRFHAVVFHGLDQYPAGAVRAAAIDRIPYFVYARELTDQWREAGSTLNRLRRSILRQAHRRKILEEAAGVIFSTEAEMQRSVRSFYPYSLKGMLVPAGTSEPPGETESQLGAFAEHYPSLQKRRFLLYEGPIHQNHGCDLLLHAFSVLARHNPEVDLVMGGPSAPEYLASWRDMMARTGLGNRILWAGAISGHLKWALFRAADAFVLPSRHADPSIRAIEAMSVGTPVLLSDKANIWREVVRSGAGLVESGTRDGIKRLLQRWFIINDKLRPQFRRNSEICHRTRFNAEIAGRALILEIKSNLRQYSGRKGLVLRAITATQSLDISGSLFE